MTNSVTTDRQEPRFNHQLILSHIEKGASVLDLGCGDGSLLETLVREKDARVMGVDKEEAMVRACLARGLSVFQGDLDEGLADYETQSVDYVILNQTLQMVHRPVTLLLEMLRVGRMAIVNFPNFAYLPNRLQLMFGGRMPENKDFPYSWYDTPNIHFCTRNDFVSLCDERDIQIVREIHLRHGKRVHLLLPNISATEVCLFLRSRLPRRD